MLLFPTLLFPPPSPLLFPRRFAHAQQLCRSRLVLRVDSPPGARVSHPPRLSSSPPLILPASHHPQMFVAKTYATSLACYYMLSILLSSSGLVLSGVETWIEEEGWAQGLELSSGVKIFLRALWVSIRILLLL
eukprot:746324-Hanusia_phi.AAC.2